MLARNFLKAGDYIEPVPEGIPVTLQYSDSGTLEYVKVDSSNFESESKELFSLILKSGKVPTHISTNRGTVMIKGVVYTGKHNYETLGKYPEAHIDDILSDIRNKSEFNVFAGHVYATSINFKGSAQIRTWIQSQGFNLLPSMLVPVGDVELAIKNFLKTTSFRYEEIISYFVFRGEEFYVCELNNMLDKISNIEVYLDKSGYVRSKIDLTLSESPKYLSYYEVATGQLYTGDSVLINCEGRILHKVPAISTSVDSIDYSCPFCGRHYKIEDDFSRCPDSRCMSKKYLDIVHFLNKLNLPELDYDDYLEYVNSGELRSISDVFMLPIYKDVIVEISLYDILDAIIPVHAVRSRNSIWNYLSACNSSLDTVYYYMEHPQLISKDLHIDDAQLATWFSDIGNVSDVKDVIKYTNVILVAQVKKFEGSPIFRDKKIFITGKFKHGSISEVVSILQSYSATVTYGKDADCCVVGDIQEDIDGATVSYLKESGVPIFNESEFFTMYDIDSDLP